METYSVIFKNDSGASFIVIATDIKSINKAKELRICSGDYVAKGNYALGLHTSTPPEPLANDLWLSESEKNNKNSYAYKLIQKN